MLNHLSLVRFRGLSTNCGTVYSRGLTEDEKWRVLDHHNRLRSQVARGQTSQPPARYRASQYKTVILKQ